MYVCVTLAQGKMGLLGNSQDNVTRHDEPSARLRGPWPALDQKTSGWGCAGWGRGLEFAGASVLLSGRVVVQLLELASTSPADLITPRATPHPAC